MGNAIWVPGVNWSNKNLGTVTLSGTTPIQSLNIIGPDSVISKGQYKAEFLPVLTTQRTVVWSIISGSEYAEINQNGELNAKPGAQNNNVTIRCAASSNPAIYADKNIIVTFGTIVYYDYIESDGNAIIVLPGYSGKWGVKVTVIGTVNNSNGYLFGVRSQSNSTQARLAAYMNDSAYISAAVGTRGFQNLFRRETGLVKYRWEFQCSTNSSTTDGQCICYDNATDVQKAIVTGATMTLSGRLSLFTLGYGPYGSAFTDNPNNHGICRFYNFKVEENGIIISDIRPCTLENEPGVIDVITGDFHTSDIAGLTVGND